MQRTQSRHSLLGRDSWRRQTYGSDVDQLSKEEEWENYNRSRKTVFRPTEDDNASLQVQGSRTPIKRTELYKLKPGDHIGWRRSYIIWHHAVVIDTCLATNELLVIHYTKVNGRAVISKQMIDADKQNGELFRFNYSEDTELDNPTDFVLERAHNLIGKKEYHLLKNNCEHFARYCKTGIRESSQARWVAGKVKEWAITNGAHAAKCGAKLGYDIGKEVAKQSSTTVATGAGKVAVAEGIEAAGRASNWVGAGIVFGFETLHCAYDIYHLRKLRQRGKLSSGDYKVEVATRVSEGLCSATGAAIGSCVGGIFGGFIGGMLGTAVPGIGTAVGTFIGNVVGGAIGSTIGKAVGTLFGRWFGKKWFG